MKNHPHHTAHLSLQVYEITFFIEGLPPIVKTPICENASEAYGIAEWTADAYKEGKPENVPNLHGFRVRRLYGLFDAFIAD